jgi:iron complex transport system ATP-binding protein
MSAIVEAQRINFSYGSRPVFESMSFTVEPGAMVALLGANGMGKTTLLNLIAGLLRSGGGRVLVDGRSVGDWPRRELSRFVALVPQHLEIPFSFRVEEIVAQGRVPYAGRFGGLSSNDRQKVEEAMRAVDVQRLRARVYSELSGGEKQRVKIAIAVAQEPKLMLLDEPTQHLDIGRQVEIVRLLKHLNEQGISVLAAIHDLAIVRENFRKSILLMDQACVVGNTAEVMKPELLEQAFAIPQNELPSLENVAPTMEGATALQRDCRRTRTLRVPRRRGPNA